MAEQTITKINWDARQQFLPSTNHRYDICCEYHARNMHRQLFYATKTLYYSIGFFFDETEKKEINALITKYYLAISHTEKLRTRNIHTNKQSYLKYYLPATIEEQKISDELFEKVSNNLHKSGLLLPHTETEHQNDLDFDSALREMGL